MPTLVYFKAFSSETGTDLWVTDGTAGGTRIVRDMLQLTAESSSSIRNPLGVIDGNFLFAGADTGTGAETGQAFNNVEVWITDGTEGGTREVVDLRPGLPGSEPVVIAATDDVIYFAGTDFAGDREIWATDGNTIWAIANLSIGSSMPTKGVIIDGRLLVGTGEGGVWVMNPDPAPTTATLLTSVNTPGNFFAMGSKALFTVNGAGGAEIWVTNLTAAGTKKLMNGSFGLPGGTVSAAMLGDTAIFASGGALYKTDGTTAGTVQIGPNIGVIRSMIVMDGKVFMAGGSGANGVELYVSDGETTLTRLTDIAPGAASAEPNSFVVHDGLLYFAASSGSGGSRLYVTDGTAAGTQLVSNAPRNISSLVSMGSKLLFAAEGSGGRELWESDGTAAGTRLLLDVNPGSLGSSLEILAVVGKVNPFNATRFDDVINGT